MKVIQLALPAFFVFLVFLSDFLMASCLWKEGEKYEKNDNSKRVLKNNFSHVEKKKQKINEFIFHSKIENGKMKEILSPPGEGNKKENCLQSFNKEIHSDSLKNIIRKNPNATGRKIRELIQSAGVSVSDYTVSFYKKELIENGDVFSSKYNKKLYFSMLKKFIAYSAGGNSVSIKREFLIRTRISVSFKTIRDFLKDKQSKDCEKIIDYNGSRNSYLWFVVDNFVKSYTTSPPPEILVNLEDQIGIRAPLAFVLSRVAPQEGSIVEYYVSSCKRFSVQVSYVPKSESDNSFGGDRYSVDKYLKGDYGISDGESKIDIRINALVLNGLKKYIGENITKSNKKITEDFNKIFDSSVNEKKVERVKNKLIRNGEVSSEKYNRANHGDVLRNFINFFKGKVSYAEISRRVKTKTGIKISANGVGKIAKNLENFKTKKFQYTGIKNSYLWFIVNNFIESSPSSDPSQISSDLGKELGMEVNEDVIKNMKMKSLKVQ